MKKTICMKLLFVGLLFSFDAFGYKSAYDDPESSKSKTYSASRYIKDMMSLGWGQHAIIPPIGDQFTREQHLVFAWSDLCGSTIELLQKKSVPLERISKLKEELSMFITSSNMPCDDVVVRTSKALQLFGTLMYSLVEANVVSKVEISNWEQKKAVLERAAARVKSFSGLATNAASTLPPS